MEHEFMKKSAKIILSALLILISLAGCKKPRTKFVIGLDANFPPMGFYDGDKLTGYDVELAQEVAKRLNLEFEAKPINWQDKDKEIQSGNIDCIWSGFTILEERQKQYIFTKPYLSNEQVLVLNNDTKVKSLADVKNFVIGCQSYSSAEDAINANPTFYSSLKSIIYSEDYLKALDDLKNRKVDGIVMDSIVAQYLIAVSDEPFVILDEPLAYEDYGIGFKKDKDGEELCKLVWETLRGMQSDGTVSAISRKYFGTDISKIQ